MLMVIELIKKVVVVVAKFVMPMLVSGGIDDGCGDVCSGSEICDGNDCEDDCYVAYDDCDSSYDDGSGGDNVSGGDGGDADNGDIMLSFSSVYKCFQEMRA